MAGAVARNRRVMRRPYFYEVFVLVNLAGIVVMTSHLNPVVLGTLPDTLGDLALQMGAYTLAGVVVRSIVARWRGGWPEYLRILRSGGWLLDTARLILFAALLSHTYFWIKLLVPILNPRDFDQMLWDLDQRMFFGFAPAVLFADLFSHPLAMRAIDWSYAKIFIASIALAFAFFLSAPARRLRVAFMTGTAILWLAGVWLYLLVPSLGPAFRFPELWIPLADSLPTTHQLQAALMDNYRRVLQWRDGPSPDVQLMFGVAAFPSLHVGFQTFAFLWMRRLWIYGEIVFGIFLLTIVIGSVVTGWHYLIDGVAGALLALVAYVISARLWRIGAWLRLRTATR
ncbi:MAG TPA: phosphatase PAP2 family protein [Thermoanaerobaculia bacterium]|nr:phosphatase PAP2 family protein [Thermoanaerobaculia bacterium]